MSKLSRLHCLSVILALMLFIPSFAVSFSDSGDIGQAYITAVDEMAVLGVISGFPDGSFQPHGTLTREQGAKITAYMILGDSIGTLTCTSAPFDDVAADRWSAPCILWCSENKILLGYGGGLYGPSDTLTGDQFAKMLLCAFRLTRNGDYSGLGDDWYRYVRDDGAFCGLYDGDSSMITDKPISRQQAALMAYNALKASTPVSAPEQKISAAPSDAPTLPVPSMPQAPEQPTSVYILQPSPNPSGSAETPEIEIPVDNSGTNQPGTVDGDNAASDQNNPGDNTSTPTDDQGDDVQSGGSGDNTSSGSGDTGSETNTPSAPAKTDSSGAILLPEIP